jgi:hypothetical protein
VFRAAAPGRDASATSLFIGVRLQR